MNLSVVRDIYIKEPDGRKELCLLSDNHRQLQIHSAVYTHHDNLGLLLISLNCSFYRLK